MHGGVEGIGKIRGIDYRGNHDADMRANPGNLFLMTREQRRYFSLERRQLIRLVEIVGIEEAVSARQPGCLRRARQRTQRERTGRRKRPQQF
jgi:hypothetical protein